MKSYTHLSPTIILLYSLYHVCIPSFYPSILPSIGCDTLKNKLQKSVRLIPNTLAWFSLTIVLFFFFFSSICGIWKFPDLRLNWSHSCDLWHSHGNGCRDWATAETMPDADPAAPWWKLQSTTFDGIFVNNFSVLHITQLSIKHTIENQYVHVGLNLDTPLKSIRNKMSGSPDK